MAKLTKIVSFFIVLFFAMNAFSLSGFFDEKVVVAAETSIEHFFSAVNMPTDILENMMSQKTQKKAPVNNQNTKNNKNCFKNTEYMGTATIVFTMLFMGFVLCKMNNALIGYFATITNCPLKVPWRMCIFLILLIKILFNVRPRAGDIYVYNYAVKRACVA